MSVPARSVAGAAPAISIRNYAIVTAAYWAFTLTDGALRMLVLLHFNQLGYTPVQLAFLFLLYEFFGIVTNLVGGWIASRTGVRFTLVLGLMLQVVALGLLAFLNAGWSVAVSVAYVMGCQALSGIAKDLTKMSAKSAVKVLVPKGDDSGLFKWVAVLTGSKNALKGAGFFVGGFLLSVLGFRGALSVMATGVLIVLLLVMAFLPAAIGQAKKKAAFTGILSNSKGINRLSLARLALFAARDVWFVVSVPIFLASVLGWSFAQVGGFMALWVIAYGAVQSASPVLLAQDDWRKGARACAREHARPRPRCGHRPDPDRTSSWSAAGIDDARRTRTLRNRVRAQFVRALVPGARVFRVGSRVAERGLLLHGERLRAPARDPSLWRLVSVRGSERVALGGCGPRCGCRVRGDAVAAGHERGRLERSKRGRLISVLSPPQASADRR